MRLGDVAMQIAASRWRGWLWVRTYGGERSGAALPERELEMDGGQRGQEVCQGGVAAQPSGAEQRLGVNGRPGRGGRAPWGAAGAAASARPSSLADARSDDAAFIWLRGPQAAAKQLRATAGREAQPLAPLLQLVMPQLFDVDHLAGGLPPAHGASRGQQRRL